MSRTAAANDTAAVQGWCPGAHRPMMSGDGLVVRVRPFRAALSPAQVRALCGLARRYGSGLLELTSRANLQIRGVTEADHPAVLQALHRLDLLDADPRIESRRNILMAPDWQPGDLTDRLHAALLETLPSLPDLPQKMGYALDTGTAAHLKTGSADVRFERDRRGDLLLRLDGADTGFRIDEASAMSSLAEVVSWFIATGGRQAGRMARHLRGTSVPEAWQGAVPRPAAAALTPGPGDDGLILGVPFGSLTADTLEAAMQAPGVTELRLMTGRLLWLRGAGVRDLPGFVTAESSAQLSTHACPGAPYCSQATVETRALATRLAAQVPGSLHISGCAKGCALPGHAEYTLVGRNGRFDLVRNGAPWDTPAATGLDPETLHTLTGIV